jgi:hypothetical protein
MQAQTLPRIVVPRGHSSLLDRYFYFAMSLVSVAVVAYGFSHTVERNLIHPAVARPFVLYVHAVVFTGWLGFFMLQSALIRTRNVKIHRKLGWAGLALGIAVVGVGVVTALTMVRFNRDVIHSPNTEAFLLVPLFDMLCFGTTFALAIKWRNRPEYHRRLILIATCALTAAGWGRFPQLPPGTFYAGVDALIVLGLVRDWLVNRRIHTVYKYALPLFALGQIVVVVTVIRQLQWWMTIAHKLVG